MERRVHWLRWLGLAGELLVLFVGGLIVSVKIGGGSNLHNMDAYLVLLLIIGVHFYLGRVEIDFPELSPAPEFRANCKKNTLALPFLTAASS